MSNTILIPLVDLDDPHANDQTCDDYECQSCCPHNEHDHYICLDCGYERDPGTLIDAAEYYLDPER